MTVLHKLLPTETLPSLLLLNLSLNLNLLLRLFHFPDLIPVTHAAKPQVNITPVRGTPFFFIRVIFLLSPGSAAN
jgi:hypothetical protein